MGAWPCGTDRSSEWEGTWVARCVLSAPAQPFLKDQLRQTLFKLAFLL